MTISTELRKAGPFTGNGVTTAFPFSFKVFAATDVTATRADTLGAETGLVLNIDFTVALNADQDAAPGGTVTLSAPLSTGYRLVVSSAVPNLQPTDITNNGGFYPRVIEDALDRHVAQVQQIDEKVGRALKVAITSPLGDQALPSPVAGMLIGWNESSDGLKNYAPIGGTLLGQQLAAANGSSLVGFQQAGTGAIVRTAQDKMREWVSVKDFGAVGDGVADDTAAIQAAIAYAKTRIMAGNSAIYGTGGTTSGTTIVLYFPSGVYKITSALTPDTNNSLTYFTVIGERSLIVADAGVTVFGGVGFNNTFQGLVFRKGAVAISVKTANLDTAAININNCEFQDQSSAHITTDATSQSTILNINQCKFYQKTAAQSFTFLTGDVVNINNSWITANTAGAAIHNAAGRLNLTDLLMVPLATLASSGRWIDNYGNYLHCKNVRFGGEFAGAPIVYNYKDFTTATAFPYISGQILIDGCLLYTNSTSTRADAGVIVAKAGLPQTIQITNNSGKVDAPYINDQMLSGDLATYITTYAAGAIQPALSVLIQNNGVRGNSLTNITAATTVLMRYTLFVTASQTVGNAMSVQALSVKDVSSEVRNLAQSYAQTSASGTTSIVDTEIYHGTPILGYGKVSTYEVFVVGNPNQGGSTEYRAISIGFVNVTTGISGSVKQFITYDELANKPAPGISGLTVSAVFWDGATESSSVTNGSTTDQIRLKIAGYSASFVGSSQTVRIVKRM